MYSEQLHAGKVIKIDVDSLGKIDRVFLENQDGEKYLLPGSEISVRLQSKLKEGHNLDFVVLHGKIASIKKALPLRHERTLDKLNSPNGEKGIITNIYSWGAHVSIQGYSCIIENADFSQDHTTIGSVYKEGDIIEGLKFVRVTSNNSIHVAPAEKYKSNINLDSRFLQKGTKVFGVVKNIKKFKQKEELYCFVGIPGGLNLLAEMPSFDVKEDDTVICQVQKIDESAGILRGAILKIKSKS